MFLHTSLPDLRFSTGNVIIKLGESPEDWLLLHKDVIQATMPVLGTAMAGTWNRQEVIQDPSTNTKVEVYSFALKFVEDTWLLEGKVTFATRSFLMMWLIESRTSSYLLALLAIRALGTG